jgi:hypothetical protein
MAEVNSKSECPYCRKNVGTNGISCLTCMNTSCSQLMHGQCLFVAQDPEASGKVLICPTCSGNKIAFCREPTSDINEDAKTKKPLGVGGRRKYKKHKKTKKHRKYRKYGKTKKR